MSFYVTDGWVSVHKLTSEDNAAPVNDLLRTVAGYFGAAADDWVQATVADALASMDAVGVDRALVTVSHRQADLWGSPLDMDRAGEAVEMSDGRFKLAFYVSDLSNPTKVARRVRHLAEDNQIAAVCTVPAMFDLGINDRRWYPIYSVCEEVQIPVRINAGIFGPRLSSRSQDPMMIEDIMVDLPELTVIAAHMGHPWERLLMRLMMKFDRLYLMTSAYLAKYFDDDLVKFMGSSRGIGRVMWASDFPVVPIEKSLAAARQLPLSDAAMEAYLGKALCDLLAWK